MLSRSKEMLEIINNTLESRKTPSGAQQGKETNPVDSAGQPNGVAASSTGKATPMTDCADTAAAFPPVDADVPPANSTSNVTTATATRPSSGDAAMTDRPVTAGDFVQKEEPGPAVSAAATKPSMAAAVPAGRSAAGSDPQASHLSADKPPVKEEATSYLRDATTLDISSTAPASAPVASTDISSQRDASMAEPGAMERNRSQTPTMPATAEEAALLREATVLDISDSIPPTER